jgi:myo-inositol-1-phosphate synthase
MSWRVLCIPGERNRFSACPKEIAMTTASSTSKRPSPAPERLGILLQGMGAVASTVVAGVLAIRQGLGEPVGSLTQLAHIRLGKRTENRNPRIRDFVPLAPLDGVVFGGWDIFGGDLYEACTHAQVLEPTLLAKLEGALREIKPMPGAFDPNYVKRLNGTHIKPGTRRDWANALRQDIRDFKAKNGLDRVVLVNCSSTEVYIEPGPTHQTLAAFERGLDEDDSTISPAMVYAYSALMEGVPYANGTPSLSADIPALLELADKVGVPIAGKDFKTGQTMLKTVLSPMFKARMLGVKGWFSTNILGNRDGEVLEDPDSFKSQGEDEARRARHHPAAGGLPRPLRRPLPRRPHQLLPAARGPKRAGTTSTSSVGSVTRCRSRSTSSAGTPSWPRPSCSTSPSSSTWRSARARRASRSG